MRGKKSKTKSPRRNGNSKNVRRDREIVDTAKREMRADQREQRDVYASKENDWRWYAQNPQLIKDYASYPFGVALGTRLTMGQEVIDGGSIPGIMALYYVPTIGEAVDANSPINIAARNIYSFVRHANSGHSNYDAPDLMLYLIAMDSIYMYIAYLKRLYGVLLDYTPLNRYYPAALISAMGADPQDLAEHMNDLRGLINQLVVKVGSMCVPNSMSYMARHSWMTEGLYTDSMAAKAQTYLYVPTGYYTFSLDSNGAGQLSLYHTNPVYLKLQYESIAALANTLMDPVLAQEDFNIMSGDILKAFGPEGVVKIAGITDGFMVLPVYNQEVLSQIENCTILGGMANPFITQDTSVGGGFLTQNTFNASVFINDNANSVSNTSSANTSRLREPYVSRAMLNFHHDNVAPEEVMVATRLTFRADSTITNNTQFNHNSATKTDEMKLSIRCMGSELVERASIFYYTYNATTGGMQLKHREFASATYLIGPADTGVVTAGSATNLAAQAWLLATQLATFDWAPQVQMVPIAYDAATGTYSSVLPAFGIMMDVDNYTIIDEPNLYNMTSAAMLSEFSVPQMGAFANK